MAVVVVAAASSPAAVAGQCQIHTEPGRFNYAMRPGGWRRKALGFDYCKGGSTREQ